MMVPTPLRNYTIVLAVILAFTATLSSAGPAAAQDSTLAAPTLTAQANDSAIELSWDAVDGAARYQLATRPRGGEWLYLDNNTLTDTTFTHTDPAPATTHAYQVRAVSENGDTGEWSQRVAVTFGPTLVAPTLTLQAAIYAFDLTWSTVAGAAGYQLIVWSGSGNWQQLGGGDLTGNTYSHTELAAESTYHYAIRAVTATEAGPWSEQVSATATGSQAPTSTPTPTPTPGLTPTPTSTATTLSAPELSAQAAAGAVELNWNAVAGAARYELWAWTEADGRQRLDDGALTGTTFNYVDVEVGTTYQFTVRAVGPAGELSEWSAWVPATVTTPSSSTATPTATPSPTSDVTATATSTPDTTSTPTATPETALPPPPPALDVQVSEDSVQVSWDPVKGAVRYVLWVWTSSGGLERLDNGSLTGTTYTHENLEAGSSYHYTARAVNATGVPSSWSPYVTAAIPAEISLASQVFNNVSPSIAFVDTETGSGSGVLIEGGWIVTNSHVVWPFTSVRVTFPDGTEYSNLPVRYYDHLADLALLGPVSTPTQYATMLDGEALPIGSPVYLIGYPGEYEKFPQPTFTEGIHSRLRQWEPGPLTFFQSDSTIFSGQSGGALVSSTGAVIGISGFKVYGEFALVTSSGDLLPRIRQLLAGQQPSGIGPRLIPLEGGALTHTLTLNNYWDEQIYVINEPSKTVVRFSLLGDRNGSVTITDSIGREVLVFDIFDETGFEFGAFITSKLAPHFLIVRQKSLLPGTFTVAASHNLAPFTDPDRARQIQVGQTLYGNIDVPLDTDYYVLNLVRGQSVEVRAQSILADMVLTMSLGSPTQTLTNDDAIGLLRRDARLRFRAPITGPYFLIVEDFGSSAPGGYILSVSTYTAN